MREHMPVKAFFLLQEQIQMYTNEINIIKHSRKSLLFANEAAGMNEGGRYNEKQRCMSS